VIGDTGFTPPAVLQPDGRIVAANFMVNFAPTAFYVVRFDASGVPDPSFDPDAWARTAGAERAASLPAASPLARGGRVRPASDRKTATH
jgi:hypothetical protein